MVDAVGEQISETPQPVAADGQPGTGDAPSEGAAPASNAAEGPAAAGSEEKPVAEAADASTPVSSEAEDKVATVETAVPAEVASASGGETPPEGEAQASGEGASAGEKPAGRKRKRRKKARAEGARAETAAEAGGGEEAAGKTRRKESFNTPFARFLTGAVNIRRHAFAVGEEVAGRVVRCDKGAIVIDLFGKATAVADELEPREIPPMPVNEEPPAPAAGSETAARLEGEVAPIELAEPIPAIEAAEPVAAQIEEVAAPIEPAAPEPSGESAPAEPSVGAAAETGSSEGDDVEEEDNNNPVEEPLPPLNLPPIEVGRVFRGRIGAIAESGHVALVNRIIDINAVLAAIEKRREERKRVSGVVFGFNRGGFDVIVEGIRAFCPASGMSFEEIEDPKQYLGQKLDFTLPPIKGGSKDLVVTRRSILEKERRKKVKELIRSLKLGQKLKGRVTEVRDYGLFVDIGGVDGLVHQSELSFVFGVKPQDVAKIGDEVDVQVLRVGSESDGNRKDRTTKISLSMKALMDDPWDVHADLIAEGSVRVGKVIRTTDFGAFVELAPSVEGLLRIGDLGRELTHANQVLKEGEEVPVVIERVDRHARRISLSRLTDSALADFKAGKLGAEGGKLPNLHPGARITVKIDAVEHRGLVVRVVGAAGKRSRGFIPSSETGTERGTDLRKSFPKGSELEVKIIGVERDGSLKCSRKALAIDDERRAIKEYRREAAGQGLGTFGDLLRAKLGNITPR